MKLNMKRIEYIIDKMLQMREYEETQQKMYSKQASKWVWKYNRKHRERKLWLNFDHIMTIQWQQ